MNIYILVLVVAGLICLAAGIVSVKLKDKLIRGSLTVFFALLSGIAVFPFNVLEGLDGKVVMLLIGLIFSIMVATLMTMLYAETSSEKEIRAALSYFSMLRILPPQKDKRIAG